LAASTCNVRWRLLPFDHWIRRDSGRAYGLVETGNALAVILAPLVAGFLYQSGPESVYTISMIALILTSTLTIGWYLWSARR